MCKIDRLTQQVVFQLEQPVEETLNQWKKQVNNVLGLIDLASNMIKREIEAWDQLIY